MSLNLHLFVRQQYNMDGIDITDSAFALDVPDIMSTSGVDSMDYTMFIYIGVAIVAAIIGFIMFYQNKTIDEEDCPGGFCTMDHHHSSQV
jgi:hypothetical protein